MCLSNTKVTSLIYGPQILPSAEEFWAFQKSIANDIITEFGESRRDPEETSAI